MNSILKILFFLCALLLSLNASTGFPESYYKLHISKQKEYFFKFFSEEIELENNKILKDRAFIKSLNNNVKLDPSSIEYKKLQKLQKKYKVKDIYNYSRFLERVDIIPPSLALAQAATESGWGKSRFFKEANNIFGHWTFNKKIGIKPLQRDQGKKHFIRIFPNLQESIAAYMLNLNRNAAYYEFRLKRKEQKFTNNFINGLELSDTMKKYSAIGNDYIKILKAIILKNNLIDYDRSFQEKIKINKGIK